jgi:hypothetical protein
MMLHFRGFVCIVIERKECYPLMDINSRKLTRYIWPEDAKRLVAKANGMQGKKPSAVLLHDQLEKLTGFSSVACWRFLERNGIRRPGSGRRKIWADPAVIEFVMDHGYQKASEKFDCSKKSIYNAMQRQQRSAGHTASQFSLNQLRQLLKIRIETIKHWISAGYLEATPYTYGGKQVFIVSEEQLRRFLKREAGNMLPRRFPEKRVEFLSTYLFNEKHMNVSQLHTRESKKEGEAYREHMAAIVAQSSLSSD